MRQVDRVSSVVVIALGAFLSSVARMRHVAVMAEVLGAHQQTSACAHYLLVNLTSIMLCLKISDHVDCQGILQQGQGP